MPTTQDAVRRFAKIENHQSLISDEWSVINEMIAEAFVDEKLENALVETLDAATWRYRANGFNIDNVGTSLYLNEYGDWVLYLYPVTKNFELTQMVYQRSNRNPLWFESIVFVLDEDGLIVSMFARDLLH